jgi:hypothetical protein
MVRHGGGSHRIKVFQAQLGTAWKIGFRPAVSSAYPHLAAKDIRATDRGQ